MGHLNSELLIQHEDLNLILRFAVTQAKLTRNEKISLAAWLQDEPGPVTAARCGLTRGLVSWSQRNAFRKIKRQMLRLGIRSADELLLEFDTRPPDEPKVSGWMNIRPDVRRTRDEKRAAFAGAVS